jgi:hypothetical protein
MWDSELFQAREVSCNLELHDCMVTTTKLTLSIQSGISNHNWNTGSSKKMDGIWNRYNLKRTGRIYKFGVLKFSEKW